MYVYTKKSTPYHQDKLQISKQRYEVSKVWNFKDQE